MEMYTDIHCSQGMNLLLQCFVANVAMLTCMLTHFIATLWTPVYLYYTAFCIIYYVLIFNVACFYLPSLLRDI